MKGLELYVNQKLSVTYSGTEEGYCFGGCEQAEFTKGENPMDSLKLEVKTVGNYEGTPQHGNVRVSMELKDLADRLYAFCTDHGLVDCAVKEHSPMWQDYPDAVGDDDRCYSSNLRVTASGEFFWEIRVLGEDIGYNSLPVQITTLPAN